MVEQGEELLPEHWLDSQRLMVGLTLALVQRPGSSAFDAMMEKALNYLRPPPEVSDQENADYIKRLETIHPATLQRLTNLSSTLLPAKWESHLAYWEEANVLVQRDGERFPLLGAQLIADRILNSKLTQSQIQQIGIDELSSDWKERFPLQAMGELLEQVQGSSRDPEDMLKALHRFRRSSPPPRWQLVENALLQKLFIWPLLILKAKDKSLEFSLPVTLKTATSETPLPPIVNAGLLDATEWEASIRDRATKAAKELWKNKHKSSPPWLKEGVERLSASLDLNFAAQIIQPYATSLSLTGESAEAYFALAILAKLVDPIAIENICATGKIIDEEQDWEGGSDHKLKEPDYVNDKFIYARDSYFFNTFLTPKPSSGATSDRHLYVPREIKVKFHDPHSTYFSHFCDHVFAEKWRKHQFFRAPDLAEAFRPSDHASRQSRNLEDDREVQEVLERMTNDGKPVLHIDDIQPNKIAMALSEVNRKTQATGLGSFSFLRVTPDILNERMWWPVWDLIEGGDETFDRFRFASTSHRAAVVLAKEMNKRHPQISDPRRAPDVLVVAYTGGHSPDESNFQLPGSPFTRLRIESMIPAINALPERAAMKPTTVPGLRRLIGETRIIFVRDELNSRDLARECQNDVSLDEESRSIINRLSVFRFGFKREHARYLLDLTEDACDRTLAALCKAGSGNDSPLIFSEGAGEYYVSRSKGVEGDLEERAELHFEAANAITGLLSPKDGVFRTNLRDALSPRWVHEAQWHLSEAQNLIKGGNAIRLGAFRQAQQRISRLAEPFGWTSVRWSIAPMRARRTFNRPPLHSADFLADSITRHFAEIEKRVDGKSRFFRATHPVEYILAARYFNELALQVRVDKSRKLKFLKIRDQYIETSKRRAENDNYISNTERSACIFQYASAKYCMILSEKPDESGIKKTKELVKIIENYEDYHYCLDRNDRNLFEYLGDQCNDPCRALHWYRLGISNPRIPWMKPWPSLAFKFIGAAKAARRPPPDDVKSALDELWDTSAIRKDYVIPIGGLHKIPRVKRRWKVGRLAILTERTEFGS